MLTYQLDKSKGPMYQQLYEAIKSDIISGKLEKGFKLPSKRTLARNYSLSTITIQNKIKFKRFTLVFYTH